MAFGDIKGTANDSLGNVTNPSVLTVPSISVAIGDLIVAVFSQSTALAVTAATDNLGNTYVASNAGTLATGGGNGSGRMFYSRVTAAGTLTAINFAATPTSTNNIGMAAAVFEGPVVVSPVDTNPANNTLTAIPLACPATGGLSQAVELVVIWSTHDRTNTMIAVSGGGTLAVKNGGNLPAAGIGYLVTAATGTVSLTFTGGTAPNYTVNGTTSFKAASSSTAHVGQARFAGEGVLSANATLGARAATRFAGVGSFSARVDRTGTAEATFQGEGTIGFNAIINGLVAATFQGSGTFSARAQLSAAASVVYNGAGSFSANSLDLSVRFAVVSFQGAGGFSAQATLAQGASVTYNGAGAFSALATTWKFAAVTYQGAGSLSLFATIPGASTAWPAEIRFGGNSTFSALARSGQAALVQYGGQSAFTISGLLRNQAQIRFSGAGGFSAYANLRMRAAATFQGAGTFAALLSPTGVVHLGLCRFAGSSDFYCEAARVAAPPPFYDYPIGHGLYSDYGRRASMIGYKPRMIIGRRPK